MESLPQNMTGILEALVHEYKEYARIMEQAETEKKNIAGQIKTLLEKPGTAFAGEYKITWSTYDKTGIDVKQLEKEYPAIAKLVAKTTPCDRLTVN